MREVQCLELHAIIKTFNTFNLVVREVEDDKFGEERQVFHALNFVLVQVEAPETDHVVQSLNLIDTIAFKPNRLDFGIFIEIFDGFEALVVEIELRIADWGSILPVELANVYHILVCKLVSAIIVLLHDGVFGRFKQSCQPWKS